MSDTRTKHDKEMFPYVVLGDGEIAKDKLARSLRLVGKTPNPVPQFMYAQTLEKAQQIAEKMKPWSQTILICKIEEVVQ